jgi:hypothetical protein
MAKVSLMVRSKKINELATVYIRYREVRKEREGRDGRDIDVWAKTGYNVRPEYWSNAKQELKPGSENSQGYTEEERFTLEQGLKDLKTHIEKELHLLTMNGQPVTRERLEGIIDKFHGIDKPKDKPETLNQYIDRFIKEAKNGGRLHDHNGHEKRRYHPGTIKSFEGFKVQWNLFQGNKSLNFDDITQSVYEGFVKYCMKKNYSPNTIGRHIKNLKTIMNASRHENPPLHNNRATDRDGGFKVLRVPVQNIYLTEEEIRRLFDLELTGTDELYRDVFLIGCYTAQRFSDYSRINPDMIRALPKKKKAIELIQRKTGAKVVIPIRPELDHLLKKYDYRLPKTWEQKVNDRIKVIAIDAKITDPIPLEKSRGGLTVNSTVLKCNLIKTHTARRSGCTNMFKAGIPTIEIMKLSGHKTEKEFLKYILIDEEETAERLSKHAYFNKPVMRIAR